MVWSLFIIDLMGLFFYNKIGSIISIGDLPTTNIIEPDLDKKILWEWLQLMEYMAENGGQHMRIGLDLTSGFLVFSRMAAILKRYLEYNRFITIEAYDRTRHYDLLVTNNPIHKKEQTPVYYLKNDLDMEDLAAIRQLLFT